MLCHSTSKGRGAWMHLHFLIFSCLMLCQSTSMLVSSYGTTNMKGVSM